MEALLALVSLPSSSDSQSFLRADLLMLTLGLKSLDRSPSWWFLWFLLGLSDVVGGSPHCVGGHSVLHNEQHSFISCSGPISGCWNRILQSELRSLKTFTETGLAQSRSLNSRWSLWIANVHSMLRVVEEERWSITRSQPRFYTCIDELASEIFSTLIYNLPIKDVVSIQEVVT